MRASTAPAVLVTAVFASLVAGHGHVTEIKYKGKCYPGYDMFIQYDKRNDPNVAGWYYSRMDDGFVSPDNYDQPNIICHEDATPATMEIEVAAGDEIKVEWDQWLIGHQGPVLDYLANCNGPCKDVKKETLEFFKIAEMGKLSQIGEMREKSGKRGTWGSDWMHENESSWKVKIPKDVAPGHYVLRTEPISLHFAYTRNGAQNFPQCINLRITGNGTATPPGVLATSFYKPSDPGFNYRIWENPPSYIIPGPPVWEGAGPPAVQGQGLPNVDKKIIPPKEMPKKSYLCKKSPEPKGVLLPSQRDESDNVSPAKAASGSSSASGSPSVSASKSARPTYTSRPVKDLGYHPDPKGGFILDFDESTGAPILNGTTTAKNDDKKEVATTKKDDQKEVATTKKDDKKEVSTTSKQVDLPDSNTSLPDDVPSNVSLEDFLEWVQRILVRFYGAANASRLHSRDLSHIE